MTTDKWAQWLLARRDGDSATVRARHTADLAEFRDGVLDRADLAFDDILLDVGCGTGLIGFGALERLGPDGQVIFSDVSQDLLEAVAAALTADERERLDTHMSALAAAATPTRQTVATAFLRALRP